MTVFGYSCPFVLDIFINIDEINRYNWPEDAVRGLFVHDSRTKSRMKDDPLLVGSYSYGTILFCIWKKQSGK